MNKASNMKEWDLKQSEKWKLEEIETIPGIKEDSKEIIINIHESINIIVHPWKKEQDITQEKKIQSPKKLSEGKKRIAVI